MRRDPIDPARSRALDGRLVHGVAWTVAAKWSTQVVTWISTLLVMRLLTPEDYGLVGMAHVFLGLAMLVSEFGLGTSVLIRSRLEPRELARVNSLALGLGTAWFVVAALAARPIGAFFGEPRLPAVVLAMSVVFVVASLRTVPLAQLERGLRFERLAGMEIAQTLAMAVLMLVLAFAGFGYWTLVAGQIFGAACLTALAIAACPLSFAWPRGESLRSIANVGSHILVNRLSWYAYSNADFLIIGKVLGKEALGAYTVGWTLASIPVEKVTAAIGRVTTAVFSRVQNDPPELRRYLLHITEALALITFPAAFGLALVAPDFTHAVLGAKWEAAIVPLQILSAYAAFRCITPLLGHMLNVTGNTRFAMLLNVAAAVVLPVGFLIGVRWGIAGVAAVWVVLHPLIMFFSYRRTFRTIGLTPLPYLRVLWPATSSSALMVAAVVGLGEFLTAAPPWLSLGAKTLAGAAAYGGSLFLLHRARLQEVLQLLRMLRDD